MDDAHLAKRQRTAAPAAAGNITQALGTDLLHHIVNLSDLPAHVVKWSEVCRLFYQVAHGATALGARVLKGVADGSADLTDDPRVSRVLHPEVVAAWPYLPFLITGVRNRLGGGACRVPASGLYGCKPKCTCAGCIDARRPNLLFSEWISVKKEPPANTTIFNGTDALYAFEHLPRLANAATSMRKIQFSRTAGTVESNKNFVELLQAPSAALSSVEFVWCNNIEALPSRQVCPDISVRKLSIHRCSRFTDPGALAPKHWQPPTDRRREAQVIGCHSFANIAPFVHATHLTVSRCNGITDISPLAAAKHLVFLDISTSRMIRSIPLIPMLVELRASRTAIDTTANMAAIKIVGISYTNIGSLEGLAAAETIEAVSTPLASLQGLDSPALVSLNVSLTNVADLAEARTAKTVIASGCHNLKSIESLGGGSVTTIDIVSTRVSAFPDVNCFQTVVANECYNLQSVEPLGSATDVSVINSVISDWSSFKALRNARKVNVSGTAITTEGIQHLGAVRVLVANACIRVDNWSWVLAGDHLSVARIPKLEDSSLKFMKYRRSLILDRCCNSKTGITHLDGLRGGSVKTLSVVGLRHIREMAPAERCTEVTMNRCANVTDGHRLKNVRRLTGPPHVIAAANKPDMQYTHATLWIDTTRRAAELVVAVKNAGRAVGIPALTATAGGTATTTEWDQRPIAPFNTGTATYHFDSAEVAGWSPTMTETDVEIGHGPGRVVATIKSAQVTRNSHLGHTEAAAKRQRIE
jgi:hypothetical protein